MRSATGSRRGRADGKGADRILRYWKRLPVGFVPVIVRVFPMAVETVLDSWKEEDERGRKWLRPEDAATLVDEPALASLVRRMPDLIGRGQLGKPSGHASG